MCVCWTRREPDSQLGGCRKVWWVWPGSMRWLGGHVSEPSEVVVGIETDRGLWVGALIAAGYQVYAINPKAVARYRDRHSLGGAKSDRGDAKVLADLVRTDRQNHRPVAGDSPEAAGIKVVARAHQNLIWARVRHTNQVRNALREYYPAALETFDDLAGRDTLAVLGRAPTPQPGRPPDVAPDPGSAQSRGTATQHRRGCPPYTSRPPHPPSHRAGAGRGRLRGDRCFAGETRGRDQPPDRTARSNPGNPF